MIKKMTLKKLLVTSSTLLALFLICLMPSNEVSLKQELSYVDKEVKLEDIYLLNNEDLLTMVDVKVDYDEYDVESLSKQLVEYLKLDGKYINNIPGDFKPYINKDANLSSVTFTGDTLKVEFDNDIFVDNNEIKILEGLVYTLTSIKGVNNIIIYCKGEVLTYLPKSKTVLPSMLNRNIGINKIYDITSYNDVKSVNVYYVSNHNDDYFYVPVTKYVNDKREKIDIIIDELTSSKSFNGNLMSFLDEQTKLISYSYIDDKFDLNFNEYILSDVNEESILEEVTNVINLSIKDSYDINEIIYSVDNNEVYSKKYITNK